ncbi:MAG: pyrimidine-nucleoside phosphorylase [Eubacteriales bacterium]|nr:pyrimidine-nucleoside phosphorylase [Eubacteriales bacterium]
MRVYDLILKKRNGGELSEGEIEYLIRGFTEGIIPDYQMAAFAMAVWFRGMTPKETAALTMAMANSGEVLDLSAIPGVKVDKHSTGGVGDKTTLVLAPLVAAAGVPVAKMSGRGLGHTGGTVDKLEAIPGFNTALSREEFLQQVREIGVAITSQTGNLAPADKKLYALRDVTATVDSIPLIASSVMSKKIAAGADAILLDVKAGSGAFMKTVDEAIRLAQTMVEIGTRVGRRTMALVTAMDQPLGRAVGNALEVAEAVETLQGSGPADLEDLCLTLGAYMLYLAGEVEAPEEGRIVLTKILHNGEALRKFQELVARQGGDGRLVEEPEKVLPQARQVFRVEAEGRGFIQKIKADEIGFAAMCLGAGREKKEDAIDPAVGVVLRKKVGDSVKTGETLAELYVNDVSRLEEAMERVKKAFVLGPVRPLPGKMVHAVVSAEGVKRVKSYITY